VTIPRWITALAGLTLCAAGCGGGSSTCTPDLAVNWRIVDAATNLEATCGDVGATTIRVSIDGQSMDFACPATQSAGSIPAPVASRGSHTVSITLLDGAIELAQTNAGSFAVDCSGQSATSPITLPVNIGCTPDLTISWRIVSALDGMVLTCAQAGNADTVTADIDGGGLATLTSFDSPCAGSASQGSFVALLPSAGTYNVSLRLTSGSQMLSETAVIVQSVDCSGLSATPRADLDVNF